MGDRNVLFLAEDNPGDVYLIREALHIHGIEYELFVAEDGDEAAKLMRSAGSAAPCPDVVLLDMNLPKQDGAAVLHALREHPECSTAPVIVITSSDSPRDRDRIAKLGVTRYFRKPSTVDEFMELGSIVRDVIESSKSSIEL